MSLEPVRHGVTVPLPPQEAFSLFADLAAWWPREYTWSGELVDALGLEPHAGGRLFERGPEGFTCDWGRVLAWEPPARMLLRWQIAPSRAPEPDPERASEVEVRFAAEDGGTHVAVEHRGFERHGDGAEGYRDALGSPGGWPYMLGAYAVAAGAGR